MAEPLCIATVNIFQPSSSSLVMLFGLRFQIWTHYVSNSWPPFYFFIFTSISLLMILLWCSLSFAFVPFRRQIRICIYSQSEKPLTIILFNLSFLKMQLLTLREGIFPNSFFHTITSCNPLSPLLLRIIHCFPTMNNFEIGNNFHLLSLSCSSQTEQIASVQLIPVWSSMQYFWIWLCRCTVYTSSKFW